jgi:hypothetical protein
MAGSTQDNATVFPGMFSIGSRRTVPFVDVGQVKGHLALLNQFVQLRSQVDELGDDEGSKDRLPQMPEDKNERWRWFVGLAVER